MRLLPKAAVVFAVSAMWSLSPAVVAADEVRAAPNPPNVVFILADDLGYSDLACYRDAGPAKAKLGVLYETPHLNALAADGMRFTGAYTCGPNCAPTRACLMSGQYTPRHGVYTVGSGARGQAKFRKLTPPPNNTTLAPEVVTLAETLQAAGYRTGHFGKWHLGAPGEAGPLEQGFNVNVAGTHAGHPPTYFSPYRIKTIENGPAGEYLTDRLTEEAVAFMEANCDRPFFLYLPHFAVHTPIQSKEEQTRRFTEKAASIDVGKHDNPQYAGMLGSLDESVGRILKKLDELELADNTVVVFSSDNGGVGGYADAGVAGAREITHNAPLRGGKGMLFEGGIRVPLLVRWPGVTKAGAVCDVPVTSVDFFPTLVEIGGGKMPAGQVRDGVSFTGLLRGGANSLGREAIFWHFPGYLQANDRTGAWRTTPAGAIRMGDYKLIEFFETGERMLYDLAQDIGETKNLAGDLPEKRDTLHAALKAWRARTKAPMPQ